MVELESCKLDFCSKSSKSLCLSHVESVVNSAGIFKGVLVNTETLNTIV